MSKKDRKCGWGFPVNSKKGHYFIAGRSVCLKWAFFGPVVDQDDMLDSSSACAECKRRRKVQKELEGQLAKNARRPR